MLNRRRLPFVLLGACLLLASGAAAAEGDAFTATSAPSHVKPSTPASYVVALTNSPSSPSRARRATIAVPAGFSVDAASIQATSQAVGGCDGSPWALDGTVTSVINLRRPGSNDTGLCPGATLRVSFTATSASDEATYTWTSHLFVGDTEEFALNGSQPTVVVDGTAPDTTITSTGPASPTNQTSATFTFTSGEQGSTFECSLDGAAFAACTSPKGYSGLPGGTRTFLVRAKDSVGNIDVTPASRTWTIDLVGAATQIVTAPPAATNSTSASFTFTASEQGTTFECSLDGTLFTQCTSPQTYGGLPDGPHRFAVRAVDSNTNTGPEVFHAWRVDARAPSAAVASGPPGLANSRSATFTFSADEPSSFQCRLDSGVLAPCTSPASYQNVSDGAHTFVVVPTDAVGNPGASAAYGWTVDATAPQTTISSRPGSKTTASTARFRFAANEAASAFECKLDAGRFVPCRSPKRYARLRRSRHTFSVRAVDAAGNHDATPAMHRWRIDLAKSASALISPPSGTTVAAPPLLRWRPVSRASYYNVQIYRGRIKVLSVWPVGTRFQLRARWTFLGRQYRLTAGTYRWYVWPRFGRGAAGRYGNALGQSTFTVKASARR
jgi:hypothetical protein